MGWLGGSGQVGNGHSLGLENGANKIVLYGA